VLTGLGLQECHLPVVDEWFSGIRRNFLRGGSTTVGLDYEIKGDVLYALRTGRTPGHWKGTRKAKQRQKAQQAAWRSLTPTQLNSLEKSVFDLLRRLSPPVWAVVVKQRPLFERRGSRTWPPYYWALTYLQQRVAHHVQTAHGAYQRAMFVMDETSTLDTAAQYEKYLEVRTRINSTATWPVDFGRYLVDVPVRGKSHLHQPLQLADLISHAIWRHIHGSDPLRWFPQVEPLLARHYTTGHYADAGLTYIQ
jgi:hypothetical protein